MVPTDYRLDSVVERLIQRLEGARPTHTDPAIEFNGRVLVMTASVMDAQIDLERYPMVVEVLVKPFSAAKLIATIDRALHTTLTQ